MNVGGKFSLFVYMLKYRVVKMMTTLIVWGLLRRKGGARTGDTLPALYFTSRHCQNLRHGRK